MCHRLPNLTSRVRAPTQRLCQMSWVSELTKVKRMRHGACSTRTVLAENAAHSFCLNCARVEECSSIMQPPPLPHPRPFPLSMVVAQQVPDNSHGQSLSRSHASGCKETSFTRGIETKVSGLTQESLVVVLRRVSWLVLRFQVRPINRTGSSRDDY